MEKTTQKEDENNKEDCNNIMSLRDQPSRE